MTALGPYPSYRSTGVDLLGDIPDSWTLQPAVTLARVLTSTVDKHTVEGEVAVRLCNYTDVYYHDVIDDASDYMASTASRDQIGAYSVVEGDVVFTKDSETADDIGISAYVRETLPGVVYGYHLSTYRPKDSRYGKFLKWMLDSKYAKATFQTRTLGVTRVGLSQNTVRYFRIPTPDPDEAASIAKFLDRETAEIDAFIADQEELIGLLAERRAATISHAVTKGLDPTVPMKDSGLDPLPQVPAHWQLLRNKDLLRERIGLSINGDEELLTVSHITGVTRRSEKTVTMIEAETHEGYRLVKPGDLVINTMWAWMGALGVAHEAGMVSPAYGVYASQRMDYHPAFFDYLYRSRPYVVAMTRFSRGLWSSRLRLYPDVFLALPTILPPLDEQIRIAESTAKETVELDAAIADAREAISLSRERRAALISAAVTGKIDVREHGAVA